MTTMEVIIIHMDMELLPILACLLQSFPHNKQHHTHTRTLMQQQTHMQLTHGSPLSLLVPLPPLTRPDGGLLPSNTRLQ